MNEELTVQCTVSTRCWGGVSAETAGGMYWQGRIPKSSNIWQDRNKPRLSWASYWHNWANVWYHRDSQCLHYCNSLTRPPTLNLCILRKLSIIIITLGVLISTSQDRDSIFKVLKFRFSILGLCVSLKAQSLVLKRHVKLKPHSLFKLSSNKHHFPTKLNWGNVKVSIKFITLICSLLTILNINKVLQCS